LAQNSFQKKMDEIKQEKIVMALFLLLGIISIAGIIILVLFEKNSPV
jgi:hypothetical protein